jgi:hypothetical protein
MDANQLADHCESLARLGRRARPDVEWEPLIYAAAELRRLAAVEQWVRNAKDTLIPMAEDAIEYAEEHSLPETVAAYREVRAELEKLEVRDAS